MELSFEINTIATVGADLARKAARRKRNSTVKDPEPVKQQKFNNGAPFTAKSPPRCSRESVALKEETETFEQQTLEDNSILRKKASARPKHKLRGSIKEELPSEQRRLGNGSPVSSSRQSKAPVSKEAIETPDERGHEHGSIIPTISSSQAQLTSPSQAQLTSSSQAQFTSSSQAQLTSSSQAQFTSPSQAQLTSSSQVQLESLSTVESQIPSEEQKPTDNSPLSTSSLPKTPALTEKAKTSEEQALQHGPSLQAKRTRLITIEELMPRKQRKLNDGSALRILSPPKSFTLTAEGSSSQSSKRTYLSTIDDESPRKQQKLDNGSALSTLSQSDRSSTPVEAKRNKGGRPRSEKQFPPQKELRVRTMLRTNRPVTADIPFEIWESILGKCPLECLLKAVNIPYFSHILLRNENTWRLARVHQFGHDMPAPPPGISEYKYANLLVGSGCHGCGDKLTRKVYWGFVRRWCDSCLKKNVLPKKTFQAVYAFKDADEKKTAEVFEKICECVPKVWYDGWHHYQWVGDYEEPPAWAKTYPNGQHNRFSKVRFRQMEEKVRASPLTASSTEEEIEAWFAPHLSENIDYTEKLQEIEGWCMTNKLFHKSQLAAVKGDRVANFKERALQMEPPLAAEALELCPSYERAIKIATPFTEKVWSVLKAKLVNERAAAEFEVSFPTWECQRRLHATY